jgi:hypothetical protein
MLKPADSLCGYCHKYLNSDELPFVGIVTISEASGQLFTFDGWLYHFASTHAWVPPPRFVRTILEEGARVVAARGPIRVTGRGTRRQLAYRGFLCGSRVRFDTISRDIEPLRFQAFLAAFRSVLDDANAIRRTTSSGAYVTDM